MNRRAAEDFAREQMAEAGEDLKRAETVGPFVVALVELAGGGFQNRVAQPAVVLRNRKSRLPEVAVVATYGRGKYRQAARRFTSLVDEELT